MECPLPENGRYEFALSMGFTVFVWMWQHVRSAMDITPPLQPPASEHVGQRIQQMLETVLAAAAAAAAASSIPRKGRQYHWRPQWTERITADPNDGKAGRQRYVSFVIVTINK